jgi:hypothetical protein
MTTLMDTCPACKGTGREPRQGTEADADMHPILSKEGALCWRCLGACKAKLTPEEIANRSK